jgi:hypothetical protein
MPLYQDFLDLQRELCLRLIKGNLSPTSLEAANALLGSADADARALDAEQETAKIHVLPEATTEPFTAAAAEEQLLPAPRKYTLTTASGREFLLDIVSTQRQTAV